MFTDLALEDGIITMYEADQIEGWIEHLIGHLADNQLISEQPPKDIKPLWDRVCLHRCGGNLQ
jgi:hypothetical protein